MLFYFILFYFIFYLLSTIRSFLLPFFHLFCDNLPCSGMFRNVPGCSRMLHVPGFVNAQNTPALQATTYPCVGSVFGDLLLKRDMIELKVQGCFFSLQKLNAVAGLKIKLNDHVFICPYICL